MASGVRTAEWSKTNGELMLEAAYQQSVRDLLWSRIKIVSVLIWIAVGIAALVKLLKF